MSQFGKIGDAEIASLAEAVRERYRDQAEEFVQRQITAQEDEDALAAEPWRRILAYLQAR